MSAGKAVRLTRVRFLRDCGIHNAGNMARAQSTQVRSLRDRGPSALLMDESLELMALFARPRPVASDCCSRKCRNGLLAEESARQMRNLQARSRGCATPRRRNPRKRCGRCNICSQNRPRLKARSGLVCATGVASAGKDRHWTSELAQRLPSGQTGASDSPAAAELQLALPTLPVKRARQIHQSQLDVWATTRGAMPNEYGRSSTRSRPIDSGAPTASGCSGLSPNEHGVANPRSAIEAWFCCWEVASVQRGGFSAAKSQLFIGPQPFTLAVLVLHGGRFERVIILRVPEYSFCRALFL